MTQYVVGLTHKTRSQALTIEAEDALIAALKAKHANPDATVTYGANPIGAEIIVIPITACRTRNEPSPYQVVASTHIDRAMIDAILLVSRFRQVHALKRPISGSIAAQQLR